MDHNRDTNETMVSSNYNNGNGMYQNSQSTHLEEPVSVKEWVVTYLILMIPLVNIVMLFVWGFGDSAKMSKANAMKAYLILSGIIIGLYVLVFIIFGMAIFSML